jgi:hypothetical protein
LILNSIANQGLFWNIPKFLNVENRLLQPMRFIKINDRPIVKKKSVEWCLKALEKCWEKKNNNIRQSEKVDARKAYDESKIIYENLLKISN